MKSLNKGNKSTREYKAKYSDIYIHIVSNSHLLHLTSALMGRSGDGSCDDTVYNILAEAPASPGILLLLFRNMYF